jgi:hypothetical protein
MIRLLKITVITFLSIGLIAILQLCKKSTLPVVTTEDITEITQTSAVNEFEEKISEYIVYYRSKILTNLNRQ